MEDKKTKVKISKPSLLIALALALVVTIALGIFIGKIMEYNEIQKEKKALELNIASCRDKVGELEHEYNAEMDDAYIESVAKSKLDLVNPDEIIVFNDVND